MGKVIVIRHSDDDHDIYQANLKRNEDGSYTANFGKADAKYDWYIKKHGPHFSPSLFKYAIDHIENKNKTNHKWSIEQVKDAINRLGYTIPATSVIEDIAYTANMAYADFHPDLLTEDQCIIYAMNVANDIDGYEGIQLYRWIADQMGKNANINWEQFI